MAPKNRNDIFQRDMLDKGYEDTVTYHRNGADAFFEQNDEMFDLIFIDGDHRYEQAKKDLDNSMPCLAEGGIIAYDDADQRLQGSNQVGFQTDFASLEGRGFILNYVPRDSWDPRRILPQTLFAVSTEKIKKPRKAVSKKPRGRKKSSGSTAN